MSKRAEGGAQTQPRDFRLNEILVPLDLSEMSFKALQYASSFAARCGARLTLLHVLQPVSATMEMGAVLSLPPGEISAMEQRLKGIRDNRVPSSIASDVVVRVDFAADGILNAAAELEPDLIILATHGRTGLQRMFLGSTAEKVVRSAGCPVLVVREQERDFV